MTTDATTSTRERILTSFRHAGSGHLYEAIAADQVRVTDQENSRSGVFTARGRWLSGDLKQADPFLCEWLDHKSREAAFKNPLAGV